MTIKRAKYFNICIKNSLTWFVYKSVTVMREMKKGGEQNEVVTCILVMETETVKG